MRQPDDPGVDPADPPRPTLGYKIAWAVLAALFLLCLYMSFTTRVLAHEWFINKHNPVTQEWCCSGDPHTGDCKVIADADWWQRDGLIFVRWVDGREYAIPAAQALPSQDRQGRAAACVLGGRLRCFFLPTLG